MAVGSWAWVACHLGVIEYYLRSGTIKNISRTGKRHRPKTAIKGKRYRCATCHKRSPRLQGSTPLVETWPLTTLKSFVSLVLWQ